MSEKPHPYDAIDLSNDILIDWDKKKIHPVLAYAAAGSLFIQMHQGLGKGKEEFISTAKEMADITWRDE